MKFKVIIPKMYTKAPLGPTQNSQRHFEIAVLFFIETGTSARNLMQITSITLFGPYSNCSFVFVFVFFSFFCLKISLEQNITEFLNVL